MNKHYAQISIKATSQENQLFLEGLMSTSAGYLGAQFFDDHLFQFCFSTPEYANPIIKKLEKHNFQYQYDLIPHCNWNREWEKSYEPISVPSYCNIIAPHHSEQSLPLSTHTIIINPEMSFGTGHHETTFMMIEYLGNLELKGKTVLDFGCGTGILAILCAKEQAYKIDAIDYDSNCVESSVSNMTLNKVMNINISQGEAHSIHNQYDLILANVNLNVILMSIQAFWDHLNPDGELIISGILTKDEALVIDKFWEKFYFIDSKSRGEWMAMRFKKISITSIDLPL